MLDKYGQYINLSSVAMKIERSNKNQKVPDPKALECAHKEIYKLLENDQFHAFDVQNCTLNFLNNYCLVHTLNVGMTSFDALLGNQVGRHSLSSISFFNVHAEENLRFWESVIEFRQLKK
uniref:RGS domain-containing protein n=1 Tax=Meloidogyne enterolobii TaxID=390850 RepID=A0A6V7WX37_MELEN|nr:unnamed protein product [Meloidogyne enterolobii]